MTHIILLLAGSSTRFGGDTPKQFIKVKNHYIFEYPLFTFDNLKETNDIYLVINKDYENFIKEYLLTHSFKHNVKYVLGGSTRQESVFNALNSVKNLAKPDDFVLIHDACRALIKEENILELINTLKTNEGATIATPLIDSLCKEENGNILNSINRNHLYKLQTPQAFKFAIIYQAHLKAKESNNFTFLDDTSIAMSCGAKIKIVEGSELNFKITTKDDLKIFEKLAEDIDFGK